MNRKMVIYCNTKKIAEGDATRTKLTLDYSQCSQEDIEAMADDSAVIKWQSAQRRGNSPIPADATYIVPKPGTRAAVTMTPYQMLEGLFGKEKTLELVNKAGGNIDSAIAMFKGLLAE